MKFNLIDYVLREKELKQKDLAQMLGVSAAQISKWKSGEDIPSNRELEIMRILGEDDLTFASDLQWRQLTGSAEKAQAWVDYMGKMNDELGDVYPSDAFREEPEFYTQAWLTELVDLGLTLPNEVPNIEDPDPDNEEYYEYTAFDQLISDYLEAAAGIGNWCEHFLPSYEDDSDVCMHAHDAFHIGTSLAIKHVDDELLKANGFDLQKVAEFIKETEKAARHRIDEMCSDMNRAGIPLKHNYYAFIHQSPWWLDDDMMLDSVFRSSPRAEDAMDHQFSYAEKRGFAENKAMLDMLDHLIKEVSSLKEQVAELSK